MCWTSPPLPHIFLNRVKRSPEEEEPCEEFAPGGTPEPLEDLLEKQQLGSANGVGGESLCEVAAVVCCEPVWPAVGAWLRDENGISVKNCSKTGVYGRLNYLSTIQNFV